VPIPDHPYCPSEAQDCAEGKREDECPAFADLHDWRYQVANGDTKLGFYEWRVHNAEALSHDRP